MSRAYAFSGVCLAGLCGVLVTYSSLRPEFEKQKAERLGEFSQQHDVNDNALSQAIISDLKEAGQQIKPTQSKGFAWGIREAIWGSPEAEGQQVVQAPKMPMRSKGEMKESPAEVLQKDAQPSRSNG